MRGMPMWREAEREREAHLTVVRRRRERGGRNTMKTDRRNGSGKFFDDHAGSQGRSGRDICPRGGEGEVGKGSHRAQMG